MAETSERPSEALAKRWGPIVAAGLLGGILIVPAVVRSVRSTIADALQASWLALQKMPAVQRARASRSTSPPARTEKNGEPDFGILLFYDYVEVSDLESLMKSLETLCKASSLAGRLRVSFEGLNGCLSGSWQDCHTFIEGMRKGFDGKFSRTDFKLSPCRESQQFRNLKVWQSDEVCGLFANEASDGSRAAATKRLAPAERGVHLSPEEWHKMLGDAGDDVVLFDVRNKYETRIGRFARRDEEGHDEVDLVDPDTRFFYETPDFLSKEDNLQRFENKRVMMYCTGGVRCERTSALLKEKLPQNAEVYQLSGGIQRYLEAFPSGGFFEGAMHVFDRRGCIAGQDMVAPDVAKTLPDASILGRCSKCGVPWDRYQGKWSCGDCGLLVLVCTTCQGKLAKDHSKHQDKLRCELCEKGAKQSSPISASAPIRPRPAPRPAGGAKAPAAGLPKAWPELRSSLLRLSPGTGADAGASPKKLAAASWQQAAELQQQLLACLKARRVREALAADEELLASLGALLRSSATAFAAARSAAPMEATLGRAVAQSFGVFDFLLRDAPLRAHVHRIGRPSAAALDFLLSVEAMTTTTTATGTAAAATTTNTANTTNTTTDATTDATAGTTTRSPNANATAANDYDDLQATLREGVSSALRVFWRSCDVVEARSELAARSEAWRRALQSIARSGLRWAAWEVALEYCTAVREVSRQQSLRGILAAGDSEAVGIVCDIIKMVVSGTRSRAKLSRSPQQQQRQRPPTQQGQQPEEQQQEEQKQKKQQEQQEQQQRKEAERAKEELIAASLLALASLKEVCPGLAADPRVVEALRAAKAAGLESPAVFRWADKLEKGAVAVH